MFNVETHLGEKTPNNYLYYVVKYELQPCLHEYL